MFNAVLINPPVYDFTYHNLWEKPVGLLSVATRLLHSGAASVSFVDCLDSRLKKKSEHEKGAGKFHGVAVPKPFALAAVPRNYHRFGAAAADTAALLEAVAAALPAGVPTIVLITCMMTYWYEGAVEAARMARKAFPGARIALGGIYARLMPEHASSLGAFDHVETSADMETIMANLLRLAKVPDAAARRAGSLPVRLISFGGSGPGPAADLAARSGGSPSGLLRYESSRTVAGLPGGRVMIDSTVSPRAAILPAKDAFYPPLYELMPELNNSAALVTSRGCPFDCPYCASGALYGGFTPRPRREIFSELARFSDVLGVGNVAFYDDALLHRREELFYPLTRFVAGEARGLAFHLPNAVHASMVDARCASEMKKAGFSTVRLGYEFFSPQLQRALGGKVDDPALARAVKNLLEAGFAPGDIGVYVMYGHPKTSPAEAARAARFVAGLGVTPHLSLFSPIPRTSDGEGFFASRPAFRSEPLTHNKVAFFALSGYSGFDGYYALKSEIFSAARGALPAEGNVE